MPRFGGPATMMRLPAGRRAEGLDACFVGVPFDIGTSNRPGARFGPRQIRAESALLRPYNMATRAAPFDSLTVADIGDVAINTFNLDEAASASSRPPMTTILPADCRPLTLGGDHTHRPADPARDGAQARSGRHGPCRRPCRHQRHDVRRADRPRHAVPPRGRGGAARRPARGADRPARHRLRRRGFRLAARAGLPRRAGRGVLVQIAGAADGRGARADRRAARSISASTSTASTRPSRPAPARRRSAASPRSRALEIIRGCRGLDLVGCDLVEVAPPYDPSGNTALAAANLLFEMLCVLPGVATR